MSIESLIAEACAERVSAVMSPRMDTQDAEIALLKRLVADMADAVMTTEQVADMIHCEPSTVIQYAKSGELQGVKRHRWLFRRSHVLRFISSPAGEKLTALVLLMRDNRSRRVS